MAKTRTLQYINNKESYYDLETTGSIRATQSINSGWSFDGVYAGANNVSTGLIGAYGVLTFPEYQPDEKVPPGQNPTSNVGVYRTEQKQAGGFSNLRFMVKWATSGSYAVSKNVFRWSGLDENTVSSYNQTSVEGATQQYVSWYNSFLDKFVSGYNASANLSDTGYYDYALLKSLSINDLILDVRFNIGEITYKKLYITQSGNQVWTNSYSITSTNTSYTWADIKPADKTPAGRYYEQFKELFEKGWRIKDRTAETIVVEVCTGASIIPYYGKSSKRYNPESDNYSDVPIEGNTYGSRYVFGGSVAPDENKFQYNSNTKYSFGNLVIMAESFNPELNSVVYAVPPGLVFGNTHSNIYSGQVGASGNVDFYSTNIDGEKVLYKLENTTAWNPLNYASNNSFIGGIINKTEERSNPAVVFPSSVFMNYNGDYSDTMKTNLSGNTLSYLPIEGNEAYAYSWRPNFDQGDFLNKGCIPISKVWSTIASLGCYVSDGSSNAKDAQLGKLINGNNHIYCGEMLQDGTTTGVMIQGGDILDLPQTDMDDILSDTPYNPTTPSGGGGGGEEGEDTQTPDKDEGDIARGKLPGVLGLNGFTLNYVMSGQAVESMGSSLWGGLGDYDPSRQSNVIDNFYMTYHKDGVTDLDLSVANITDYLVSLRYYPIPDLITLSGSTATTNGGFWIGTGKTKIPVSGTCNWLNSTVFEMYGGAVSLPTYSSFYNFEPNVSMSVYVPFCGTIDIAPSQVIGCTLHLYYAIDVLAGTITALLYKDGSASFPIGVIDGNIGFDIKLSGNNFNSQMVQAHISSKQYQLHQIQQAGMAAIKGGQQGLFGDTLGMVNTGAEYMISSAVETAQRQVGYPVTYGTSPISAGAFSSLSGMLAPQSAFVQICRHKEHIPSGFNDSFGRVANVYTTIGSQSGLVIARNPNISNISCTEQEKQLIYEQLQNGVII